MIKMPKKKEECEPDDKWRCISHETMVKRLARIEGENIAILALLSVLIVIVIEKLV